MVWMEFFSQFHPVGQRFQPLFVDIDDVVNVGLSRQNRGKLFMNGPNDAGIGTILSQGIERRQRMKDVTQGTHLDDQYVVIPFHGRSFL